MEKISERQRGKYKIWAMAVLLTGVCLSLYYFHVILRIEYCLDITERKRAEEALRKERDKAQKYLDVAGVMLVAIDVEGRVGLVNKKGYEILGYKEEEIIAKNWFDNFLAERVRKEVKAVFEKIVAGKLKPVEYFENPILTKDGDERLIAWHNTLLRAEQGDIIGTLSSGEDITERKRAEEALWAANQQLIASEQQLRASNQQLMSSEQQLKASNQQLIASQEEIQSLANFPSENSNPVLRVAKDGIVLYSNEAGMSLLTAWGTQMGRRLPDKWRKFTADVFGSGSSKETECEYDDSALSLTFTPVVDLGYVNIYGLDITERKKAEKALRESKELLEKTFLSLDSAVFILDCKEPPVIINCNPAATKIFGYENEEMLGKTTEFLHVSSETLLEFQKILYSAIKKHGYLSVFEFQMKRKNGQIFLTEHSVIPLGDDEGNRIGWVSVVSDITERKKAEQALKESEIKFRSLTEEALVGVYLVQDGMIKYVNPKLAEFLSYSPDELIDKKWAKDFIHSEDWPIVSENLRKRLSGELKSIRYDLRLINKDKEVIYVEAYGSATQYQGRPAVIGTLMDITERKRTQKALQESELKFKTIFENAGGAIFIADNKTGEILECNSQAEQMLGRPRAEIIGMHQSELHPKGEEEKYKGKFAAHVQKGHLVDFEGEVQHKDGKRTPVWITSQCLKVGGKDVILGLFMDTTKRKKAEQKLIENRAKLKSLASQLSLIEERERHRLATELHDQIGQSLVMSKMKLDSLRESVSSGKSADVMGEVSDCLGQVIQDTRTLTFELSSPILYELGFEAAVTEWLDEQIREKYGIKTDFEDDRQPKPLDDDIRVLLFRNVRELLVNVVKHANAKNVKVSIRKVDDRICVSVEDDGVGFDVSEVESMVTKKAKFGLFSIQERLESVGGRFEIKSKVGQGSKITMTTPLKCEKITDGA